MGNITSSFGRHHIKFMAFIGTVIIIILLTIVFLCTFILFFVDGWDIEISDVIEMGQALIIIMPIHYVFYKFSQKLVDIEIKNNILHISGNEIQGYSKASILEVNLFRLTVGVLKIDDKTYYFLPKEFYVFRFYYFTKKLRNMALIELRDFLDADVIAK